MRSWFSGGGAFDWCASARAVRPPPRRGELYLGDPPAAAEPPCQRKGFTKITLQPGQSATVRFLLTRHGLSYWDATANRWVVPGGWFSVYAGDSSALTGLPLHGGFSVAGGH